MWRRLEDYWAEIRRAFDADRTLINLNHGGVAPAPPAVLEAMIRDLRFANVAPAHQMWDVLEPRVESVRRELAREFGCDPGEVAITRNASEAMQILIAGHRPEARRRGRHLRPELPPDAHRLGPARPPRGDRGQADLPRRPDPVARRGGRAIPRGDDPEDAGGRGHPRRSTSRGTSCPSARSGGDGPRAGRRDVRRRRPRLRALPLPPRRPRLRLLRHEPAQVAPRAGRDGLPLRPQGEDPQDLAADGGAARLDGDIRKFEEIGTHPAANHNAIAALAGVPPGDRRRAQGRQAPLPPRPLGLSASPTPSRGPRSSRPARPIARAGSACCTSTGSTPRPSRSDSGRSTGSSPRRSSTPSSRGSGSRRTWTPRPRRSTSFVDGRPGGDQGDRLTRLMPGSASRRCPPRR